MIPARLSGLDHQKILRQITHFGSAGEASMEPQAKARLEEQLLRCAEEVLQIAAPRVVYRILPYAGLAPILAGNDIRRLMDGCGEAVLMALTLGLELEHRLMREEVSDMGNAYLLDLCASQAVEDTADQFEKNLREQLLQEGKYLTNRYSPGYGDFPLTVQKTLMELLNASRAIGLTLTKTNLMVPRKSITALMGISDRPKGRIYGGCARCPLLTKCSFREHGERCYAPDGGA